MTRITERCNGPIALQRMLVVAMIALSAAASAQPPAAPHAPGARAPGRHEPDAHPPRGARPPGPGWRGDIRHFGDHDWHLWRGGHWHQGAHGGHRGWWWVVGPTWYFYPTPIYPWPNPYEPAPSMPVPVSVPPPPPVQFWYFCDASQRFYPYVATCPGGWRQMPATQAPGASDPTP